MVTKAVLEAVLFEGVYWQRRSLAALEMYNDYVDDPAWEYEWQELEFGIQKMLSACQKLGIT